MKRRRLEEREASLARSMLSLNRYTMTTETQLRVLRMLTKIFSKRLEMVIKYITLDEIIFPRFSNRSSRQCYKALPGPTSRTTWTA